MSSPVKIVFAPNARTASTLIRCVWRGIAIIALQPSRRAANATPCAWLPAEAATTPRARFFSDKAASL